MRRWHRVWRRRHADEQLERELRFHLDQHIADLIAQGRDPEEARRQARLSLGGPTFTVMNGVLLKPLSYPDAERLVALHEQVGVAAAVAAGRLLA